MGTRAMPMMRMSLSREFIKLRVHGKPGPPGVDDAVVPRLAQPPHRRHGGGDVYKRQAEYIEINTTEDTAVAC